MVLVVEEAPVDSHKEVKERNSSIKRQFGNLGSWELAISIPEFNDGFVIPCSELVRENTVVAGILNVIFDGLRVF